MCSTCSCSPSEGCTVTHSFTQRPQRPGVDAPCEAAFCSPDKQALHPCRISMPCRHQAAATASQIPLSCSQHTQWMLGNLPCFQGSCRKEMQLRPAQACPRAGQSFPPADRLAARRCCTSAKTLCAPSTDCSSLPACASCLRGITCWTALRSWCGSNPPEAPASWKRSAWRGTPCPGCPTIGVLHATPQRLLKMFHLEEPLSRIPNNVALHATLHSRGTGIAQPYAHAA